MNHLIKAPFFWQQSQWNYLIERWRKNNLPHAFLFSGIQGLGKRSLALAFIKTIFCTESLANTQACGSCRSCHLFEAGSYPDYYLVEPEEEGKSIRIDQVRELNQLLNQTASLGNYKVALLTPAEALPIGAANALLKTLEEPSAGTIFILLSSQPNLLPATIRSRCQIINFQPPPLEMAQQWLRGQLSSKEDCELLVNLAERAPLRALALNESENLDARKKFLNHLQGLWEQTTDPIQTAAAWYKISLSEVLGWLMSVTMDAIRLKFSLRNITNSDSIDLIQRITRTVSVERLYLFLDQLYIALQQAYRSNPNQQLLLENLFCTWYEYTKNKPVYP